MEYQPFESEMVEQVTMERVQQVVQREISPPKTNMVDWKITILNRRYILKLLFFSCHVSFPGCKSQLLVGFCKLLNDDEAR